MGGNRENRNRSTEIDRGTLKKIENRSTEIDGNTLENCEKSIKVLRLVGLDWRIVKIQ